MLVGRSYNVQWFLTLMTPDVCQAEQSVLVPLLLLLLEVQHVNKTSERWESVNEPLAELSPQTIAWWFQLNLFILVSLPTSHLFIHPFESELRCKQFTRRQKRFKKLSRFRLRNQWSSTAGVLYFFVRLHSMFERYCINLCTLFHIIQMCHAKQRSASLLTVNSDAISRKSEMYTAESSIIWKTHTLTTNEITLNAQILTF